MTGQTPFETLMGYTPRAEIFDVTSLIPTVTSCLRNWKKAREEAQRLMIKAQKKWAQRRTLEQTFKIGDQVWLEGRNLHLDCPSIKLSPKRHGPFKIKRSYLLSLISLIYQPNGRSMMSSILIFSPPIRRQTFMDPTLHNPLLIWSMEKRSMKLRRSWIQDHMKEGAKSNTWFNGKDIPSWTISGSTGTTCMQKRHLRTSKRGDPMPPHI